MSVVITVGLQALNPPPVSSEPGDELNGVVSGLALYLVGAAGLIAAATATASLYLADNRKWWQFVLQGLNLVAVYLAAIAGLLVLRVVQASLFG
ncbi:hypothetical protein [Curtobacterium sp. TXMA1]|uniref:hypothetical protein n=1 Tax=Curtobacterium sp. TXMA1 TaxID=2876939 RepID=UPI001CCA01B5|nr:hypothetical protein [Curtobacterium sp. TXMA1]UBQ02775.1 hypothetical protein LCG91_00970 [Curtobacterium sp. TXMA1]